MKKIIKILSVLFLCAFICCSCGLANKLGFDTYDYMGEQITASLDVNGEEADTAKKILRILITDSTDLPFFDNMSQAIKEYRDAVLNFMLDDGYAKYSGNTELIEKASREYPEYNITQIVPEGDFEATMYRYFGGDVKISHKDGNRFKYLPKVGAYISTIKPAGAVPDIIITEIKETDKTYRVKFRTELDGVSSDEYFALIIKRSDGTYYIKKLLTSSSVS